MSDDRMSDNWSLCSATPMFPAVNSSFNSSLPPSFMDWEAPTFTAAARVRVAATMVLFVFAAFSNLSVLISVARGRGRRLAAHLRPLIASLASADLVMTFVVMPLDAAWNVTVQWYAGDAMCKLLCFLKLFAMHSSAFILVVVSLDRHHAILHPLDALDAGRRNKRMLLVAWVLSLLLASPQLFIFRAIKAEGVEFTQCVTHGSFHHRWQETAYNMFHFVTLYVFPLLVMSFCYTRILIEISRQMHKGKGGAPCLRRSGTDMIPKARMKTLKMTIVIVASFVICWTPYYLLGIWYWFQPAMLQETPEYVHHALFVFGNLNTCCDPVIYGFFTPSFRADLADVVHCCCRCRSQNISPRSLDRLACRRGRASGEAESDNPSGDQPSGNLG
ncbi:gonadotropin-releasing hormone II receptor-like [Salvelinus alpinus]|uniref:gonadotropin-releasing hormone II receptor-like n=1 Tax=Salvelinus sp. IW2-2015 TaxID=2691554 RepID=UPI000CDF8C54|nr:gonadotropin-releasing hormone II receptor-like [Salvelinus alpinus]